MTTLEFTPHDTFKSKSGRLNPAQRTCWIHTPQLFGWPDCETVSISTTISVDADADPCVERFSVVVCRRGGELYEKARRSVVIT